MATRISTLIVPDNSTDANFRAWAQFVEDTLVTTGGWVVTGDTGQTTPATLAHPTTTNQRSGYRIYRMADALQATAPVFMKVNFGSGTGTNVPSLWITIGGGSDGAGNITTIYWNGGGPTGNAPIQAGGTNTTVGNSYGSADTNRFSLGMFVQPSSGVLLLFTLERSKNSSGADTSDGLLLGFTCLASSGVYASRYVILSAGTQPSQEAGMSYILSKVSPSETFSGDIGVGILLCYKGVSQQPGMNMIFVKAADVASEGNFTMSIYGSNRIYQHLAAFNLPRKTLTGNLFVSDTNARVCIRFD